MAVRHNLIGSRTREVLAAVASACLAAVSAPSASLAAPPVLEFPLECRIEETCFIQNYFDADPSPGARDFQCGTRTYEGHTGTDIRVPTLVDQQRGVTVLAAAAGRVIGRRDEMEDVSVRERGLGYVAGRECGNGVTIDHGDGWATQYCHMAQGSIGVKSGQQVRAGDPIGRIGLSGASEYPHLHLTVRKDGKVVDPFAFGAAPNSCGGGISLWTPKVAAMLQYRPRAVLNFGFATGPVTMEAIEAKTAAAERITPESQALVAFVRGIGLKAGDVPRIVIKGPDGTDLVTTPAKPLERDQAQTMLFAGRKRPAEGFATGVYKARFEVLREAVPVLAHDFTMTIVP